MTEAAQLNFLENITGEAMIGGIFETIGKTLGIGKEKYFLELEDAAEKGVENLKASAAKAAKAAVETAKDVSADVADKAQSVVENASDKAQSAVADGKAKAAKQPAAAKQTAKKAAKATKQPAKSGKQPAPAAAATAPKSAAPAPAQPRSAEEIIISAITAAGKPIDSQGNVIEEAQTFATDYLMPTSDGSRRRPGPSMSPFRGMAREVNPRLKS
jgi:hypothetical protein